MTPGIIRTQVSRMPDGTTYLCVARTVRQTLGGFGAAHPLLAISLGCEVKHTQHLVYGDGIDVHNPSAAVPIGITCRLCERTDCEQRAFPAIHRTPRHRRERARRVLLHGHDQGFLIPPAYNPAHMHPRGTEWRSSRPAR